MPPKYVRRRVQPDSTKRPRRPKPRTQDHPSRTTHKRIRRYADSLAEHISPLINVTSTATIVIGGHLGHHPRLVDDIIALKLTESLPYEPGITTTKQTPLRGALILGHANIHF